MNIRLQRKDGRLSSFYFRVMYMQVTIMQQNKKQLIRDTVAVVVYFFLSVLSHFMTFT